VVFSDEIINSVLFCSVRHPAQNTLESLLNFLVSDSHVRTAKFEDLAGYEI